MPDEDGEDEAVFLDISELKQNKQQEASWPIQLMAASNSHPQNDVGGKMEGAMQPTFDAQEWRLEVERVLPALKIQVRQDNRVGPTNSPFSLPSPHTNSPMPSFNSPPLSPYTPELAHLMHNCSQDWRAHYEEMLQYREGIGSSLSETKVYLDGLHQEIAKTLEKISSREKYINNQVSSPCSCSSHFPVRVLNIAGILCHTSLNTSFKTSVHRRTSWLRSRRGIEGRGPA